MRLTLAAIALTALTTDGALASSFVYVTQSPEANSPSFVTVTPPGPMVAAAPTSTIVADATAGDEQPGDLVPLAYPLPEDGAEPVRMVPVSPSIIAFESQTPAVTFEKVAAIATAIKAHLPTPMVMRGGIIGGAFSAPEPEAVLPAQPEEKAANKPAGETVPDKAPAVASNDAAKAHDSKAASRSDAPPQPKAPASPEQQPTAAQPAAATRKTSAPQ